jgi:hypothetical protein
MLPSHLLLILALAAEMGSSRTDALRFERATTGAAFSTRCEIAGPGLSAPAAFSRASRTSPWDDEIGIPDEPEDEDPDDPGEALNFKTPTRGHFAALRSAGTREVVMTSYALRAAPALHIGGPSRTPITLCRLLF